jgi:hypothetical protein
LCASSAPWTERSSASSWPWPRLGVGKSGGAHCITEQFDDRRSRSQIAAPGSLRTMRRFGLFVALAMSVLAMSASASDARRHGHTISAQCPLANEEALIANAQAEVYVATKITGKLEGGGVLRKGVLRGCTYKARRSYELGRYEPECLGSSQAGGGCGVTLEALTGPIVAYAEAGGSSAGSRYEVFVRDLRDGRLLHKVPTGVRENPSPQNVGIGPATEIVVNRAGAVAWIAENDERSSRSGLPEKEDTYYEVHAVDKTGSHVLAAGVNIEPSSLALAGNTLYWTQGGRPASAVLN